MFYEPDTSKTNDDNDNFDHRFDQPPYSSVFYIIKQIQQPKVFIHSVKYKTLK